MKKRIILVSTIIVIIFVLIVWGKDKSYRHTYSRIKKQKTEEILCQRTECGSSRLKE